MLEYSKVVQKKYGREWKDESKFTACNEAQAFCILNDLTREFIAKKLDGCCWIKSIRYETLVNTNHNVVQVVTVTYDNGFRSVYSLEK